MDSFIDGNVDNADNVDNVNGNLMKRWTKDEEAFLMNNCGTITIQKILEYQTKE